MSRPTSGIEEAFHGHIFDRTTGSNRRHSRVRNKVVPVCEFHTVTQFLYKEPVSESSIRNFGSVCVEFSPALKTLNKVRYMWRVAFEQHTDHEKGRQLGP